MTKLERKQKYNELKRTLNQEWQIEMETKDNGSEVLKSLSHFKCYTMKAQKMMIQKPKREPQGPGKSYDGLENSKNIDLAKENEEPRPIWRASELAEGKEK